MSMTWTPLPLALENALAPIYYSAINIKYLTAFWQKYQSEFPDLVVSIKGGLNVTRLVPEGSKAFIDRSVDTIVRHFPKDQPRPKLIFEIARVDPKTLYEETIGYIKEHVDNDTIYGISLSEVGVGSIQKALSVAPVECVEIEFSLICQDILQNGVLQELWENNVVVVAYSPLGRGLRLQGHHRPVFREKLPHKLQVGRLVAEVRSCKGHSLDSLALSWILSGISKVANIVPIPSGSTPEKVDANLGSIVESTREDLDKISAISAAHPVQGYRYNEHHASLEFA
ncbi:Aldo/keto reductase [Metschnikowia bicuspidata]|uniref:Aldo/keto reductase n=1 Tax=Metschnikowia bicuspidata TaxID=27322 RepID=A0A4P9Z8A9_9ASCO|nr:Aldo/keto reductase [Metschnikowia bicuspidata]